MPDPIKIADYAAAQSDRWLLIFTLALFFLSVLALMKWFIKRLDNQTALLEGLFREANDGRVKVATVISDNSVHLQQCAEMMKENTEFIRRVNNRLA